VLVGANVGLCTGDVVGLAGGTGALVGGCVTGLFVGVEGITGCRVGDIEGKIVVGGVGRLEGEGPAAEAKIAAVLESTFPPIKSSVNPVATLVMPPEMPTGVG